MNYLRLDCACPQMLRARAAAIVSFSGRALAPTLLMVKT